MPESPIPSPEDRFANALDALSLGLPISDSGDMSLVDAARTIGALGGPVHGDVDDPPIRLDQTTKRQIWTDLIREHGGAAEPSPVPRSPGAAGSTLAPNPWLARPQAKPKRPRSSSRAFRFVPAVQPASTFLLVLAVLALVGGAFAALAPDGRQGFFPTALATEDSAHLAYASPGASPTAGACAAERLTIEEIEHIRETGATQPPREYAPATTADRETAGRVISRYAALTACDAAADPALFWSLMTDRAVLESPLGYSYGGQLERSREVSERYGEAILGEAPPAAELARFREQRRSGPPFDSEMIDLWNPELGVVRVLPDGRLAIYSAEVWLQREGRSSSPHQAPDREIFQYTIFGNPELGGGLDEPLLICLGECDGFWLDIANDTDAPSRATPVGTPESPFDYLQHISPGECTADSRPLEEIRALQNDPGEQGERRYVPAILADDGPSVEIARAARTWRACSAFGRPSQRMAMESPRLIHENGGDAERNDMSPAASQVAMDQLADDVLGDWTEYYVETPWLGATIDGGTAGYLSPDERAFLLPHHVYQLPDGRAGGPVTTLVPRGYIDSMTASSGQAVEFQIFAQDPTEGGRWVLDETLWLCPDGCDDLYASLASPAASPVATSP